MTAPPQTGAAVFSTLNTVAPGPAKGMTMTIISKTAFWPLVRKLRFAPPIAAWRDLRRQRDTLLDLDDHILRDVGLTRDMARREGRRPFWDVPPHWRA